MRMLSTDFGAQIRNERLARNWTQAGLARAAKVSRTVLSRLEQGRPSPVQTDVLDRLFAALEVKPRLPADPAMEARRLARLELQVRIEERRNRHLRLALALAGDRAVARHLIGKAKNVVELWRRSRTCSPFYTKRWSALLSLPPAELAKGMAALGEWEDAMFQNTPWSWAWN
jgi:transcriptional regulator with XRE-family HTH domain